MSSRRIGTFVNLSPLQEISINPFSELNSDNINKLTKSISNGEDGVVFGLDVINPNLCNDVISHHEILSNSSYQVDRSKIEWEYDETYCTIDEESNHINKITIQDITKCTTQTVNLKISLSDLNLDSFKGQNIQARVIFKFHIVSGCPKKLYANVNNYSNYIEYPDSSHDNIHSIDVIYNFTDNKDELNLSLTFVLDPSDTYTEHVMKASNYNGQSYVEINNISYSFDITNLKNIPGICKTASDDNYPSPYIHPTHKINIIPGIAIKDNTVIDIKSKNKKYGISLNLDLNSNSSWIKNNPFTLDDFDDGSGSQKAFVYNRTKIEDPLELNGYIDTTTKLLTFKKNGITLYTLDEYELSDNDYSLNFSITTDGIFVQNQTILSDIYKVYGNVGYIYSKSTNKIIKKINLEYNQATKNLSSKTIPFNEIDLPKSEITIDKIGIVLSSGPIKVSGKSSEYNTKMVKWGYVVLYYTYYKNPKPNKAYIGIIRDTDLNDLRFKEDYLILAKIRFITPNTVDIISYENRQQIFQPISRSSNISYDADLTDEEKNYWVDLFGDINIPTNVTEAITKIIQLFPEWVKDLIGSEHIDPDPDKQKIPDGTDGQFLKSSLDTSTKKELKFDWLMKNGIYNSFEIYGKKYNCYVVNDDEEFELCKNVLSYENGGDVNTFIKFAHTCNDVSIDNEHDYIPYQYGVSPVYVNNSVLNEINTFFSRCFAGDDFYCLSNVDHNGNAGFISRKNYSEYDVLMRCYGTVSIEHNGITYETVDPSDIYQQDSFGIIAAFVTDSNGNQHTLTFTRSGGDSEYTDSGNKSKFWSLDIDRDRIFRYEDAGVFRDSTVVLCDNSKNVPNSTPHTDSFKPWRACGDGALIHVKREGNVFTAWTSKRIINGVYNRSDPDSGDIYEIEKSKIVLDLNDYSISTYNGTTLEKTTITDTRAINLLTLFKNKSSQWGFGKVGYTNVGQVEFLRCPEMENGVDLIVHKNRNEVWIHDFYGWKLTDRNDIKTIGSGKFSYNSITGKLFWNDGTNIIDINLKSRVSGKDGQIVFHGQGDTDELHCDWIMHDFSNVFVCKTEDDVTRCKNDPDVALTKKKLHESYLKFGHSIGKKDNDDYITDSQPYNDTYIKRQYGKDSNYKGNATAFYWSDSLNSMTTDLNTIDYCGFVTKNKYKEYDVTYRYFSNNGDDDYAGFVAAFAEDSNGEEHTLSFLRTPNKANPIAGRLPYHWLVVIDKYSFFLPEENNYVNPFNQKIVVNGDSKVYGDGKDDEYGGWSAFGGNSGGVKIRVIRKGNIFKGYTSYFKRSSAPGEIENSTEIVVDLDSLLSDKEFEEYWDIIKLFTNECQYGFSTQSQPSIAFECLSVINNDRLILDLPNNRVLTYNPGTGEWIPLSNSIYDYYKYGQFSYNSCTKKFFWCDGNGQIIEINAVGVGALDKIYPVGSIYIGTQTQCPFTGILGTWVKVSQGRCLWGAKADNNPAPGTELEAGLPDITGEISSVDNVKSTGGYWNNTPNGAFKRVADRVNTAGGESDNTKQDNDVFEFKASYSNSIYGKSTTVQPPAFVVNIWQRTE